MTRMFTALTVSTLLVAGSASAQTPPPPTGAPPASQQATPPPATQKPAAPAPAPATVPFPADAKIGFISFQSVVANSELGKAGSKQMQALTEAKNQQVSAKQKEITALEQKAQSQANIVSPEALNNMKRDLDRMNRELQFLQQQAQADIQTMNDDLLSGFEQKVVPILEAIRKEMGLWVIFAVQQGEASGGLAVATAAPGIDLTMEVVKRLNASGIK